MKEREYTCIVCPKSCKGWLRIWDNQTITTKGFDCKNGDIYARNEYTDPKRMLTTTIRIQGAIYRLLPVVSNQEIPKACLEDCLHYLYGICTYAPIKEGDLVVKNILNTGVDILAARSLDSIIK